MERLANVSQNVDASKGSADRHSDDGFDADTIQSSPPNLKPPQPLVDDAVAALSSRKVLAFLLLTILLLLNICMGTFDQYGQSISCCVIPSRT
jgi:hypothetical protein